MSDLVARKRRVSVVYRGNPGDLYVEATARYLELGLVREELAGPTPWGRQVVFAEIEVGFSPGEEFAPGDYAAELVFSVWDAENAKGHEGPAVRVPVRFTVWPSVRAIPPQLFFGILHPGDEVERLIEIGPVEVGTAVGPTGKLPDGVRVRSGVSSSGAVRVYASAMAESLPTGESSGNLSLTLLSAAARPAEHLDIPYYLYVDRDVAGRKVP